MSEARSRRIESEIQRVLAALIAREVKDPRVGNVTITARVYFTPFASRMAPEQVRRGLTHAASFLRGELGRRLSLRHAPRLEFLFDESAEGAARLTSLIDRAVAADRAAHGGEPAGEGSAGGAEGPAAGSAGAGDPPPR
jgi:ribosome-binding factor A